MNISKKQIDPLNAVVTVQVSKDDYAQKVDKILKDYRKNANIPGFRKGHVPIGMVKKQYGKAILVDEVNKLIQNELQKFLSEEKLDVLGNPLPKNENEINWDADDFMFEFDLGLAPEFKVDLKKKAITHYKVVADDKMLDNQVKTIRKQYGKLISKSEVEQGDELSGTFTSDEKDIEHKSTFELDAIKGKKQLSALKGSKVGDLVTLKTKGLFKDEHDNQRYLGVSHDDAHGLDIEVHFRVEEINRREMAELNQELFDKLYGSDVVKSEQELRAKIKEDAERQFEQQSDQILLNNVVESLIENTRFELPEEFLKRWIQVAGKEQLSEEAAAQEFEKSKKGMRYQLIESRLRAEHGLQVSFDELKDYTRSMIRSQMAQFGNSNPSDEELDGISARILSNEEEVRRISEQLNTSKLLQFFKENAKLKTRELTYEKFIKEAYQ